MKADFENSFRSHLELIRLRPEVLIGKKSIVLLDVYLMGFIQCAKINKMTDPFGDFPEFAEFDSYVKRKLNAERSTLNGVYVLYYLYQENEESAFDAYFELLDRFVEQKDNV